MSSRARASDIFTRCVVNGQPTIHQVIAFRNEVVVLYLYLILYLYKLERRDSNDTSGMDSCSPVSYTHLTLPTILLV